MCGRKCSPDPEQLISSALVFGWQMHFTKSFLPLLAFRPLLTVLCWNTWCQIFAGYVFCVLLHFYISMWCVCMSVIVLAWDGYPLHTGDVSSFLVLCLVLFLRYLYACVVPAREGCAAFHAVCMLFVTNHVWKWIMNMDIDFVNVSAIRLYGIQDRRTSS